MEEVKFVTTLGELSAAVKKQVSEIYVTGELVAALSELKKAQLTETERMGSDLGGRGVLTIAEFGLNKLFGSFKGVTKEETRMNERISTLYQIQLQGPEKAYLRLKQLDY